MDYVIPAVSPNYGTCNQSTVAIWTGIGNGSSLSSDLLVQNGSFTYAQCGSSNSTRLFYEAFPQDPHVVWWDPFSVGLGDEIYVSSSVDTSNNANFYFEDVSKGISSAPSEPIYGATGSTAEWIVERPLNYEPLAVWNGGIPMNSCWAVVHGSWETAGGPPHTSVHMFTSNYSAEVATGGAWTDSLYSSFPLYRIGNTDH